VVVCNAVGVEDGKTLGFDMKRHWRLSEAVLAQMNVIDPDDSHGAPFEANQVVRSRCGDIPEVAEDPN
jgi:hypothetical protein